MGVKFIFFLPYALFDYRLVFVVDRIHDDENAALFIEILLYVTNVSEFSI